jgi:hypothetical protein
MLEIVQPEGDRDATTLIMDGKADAVFTSASSELACKKKGLHTKVLPSFPMVNSITLTTLMPYVDENPEFYMIQPPPATPGQNLVAGLPDPPAWLQARPVVKPAWPLRLRSIYAEGFFAES